jgi:lysyl-tRNA synthetase class 2
MNISPLLIKGISKLLKVTDKRSFEVASVDSTAIEEIAYNLKSSIMKITFMSGAVYNYYGVPESEYESLVEASSIGRKFVSDVRNDYIYTRIG